MKPEKKAKAEASARRGEQEPDEQQHADIEPGAGDAMGKRHRHRQGQAIDAEMRRQRPGGGMKARVGSLDAIVGMSGCAGAQRVVAGVPRSAQRARPTPLVRCRFSVETERRHRLAGRRIGALAGAGDGRRRAARAQPASNALRVGAARPPPSAPSRAIADNRPDMKLSPAPTVSTTSIRARERRCVRRARSPPRRARRASPRRRPVRPWRARRCPRSARPG